MNALAKVSHAWRVGRPFKPEVAQQRGPLTLVLGTLLAVVGLELLRPWPLQWIFDHALLPVDGTTSDPRRVVLVGAGALLAIVLVRVALEYFGNLRLTDVGHRVTRALRLRIFRHLVSLPPAFHAKHRAGDLLMRLMGDAPMVSTMLVDSSVNMTVRGLQAVCTVGVMLFVDARLTLLLLLFVPPLVWLARFLSARLTIAVRKQRRKEGELADFLQESIGATTLLQSLGREGDTVRRFARSNRKSARAGLKTARAAARLSASVEATLALALAGTVAIGGLRVTAGYLTAGELIVFISYVRGLLKPVRSATKHQARIAKGTACGERILSVLETSAQLRHPSGDRAVPARPVRLGLERVEYSYPDGGPALRGVTSELGPCGLVALFGASGAGKSTLTSLLLRIMDPDAGQVTLDGVPLQDYDLDDLRGRLALSMQSAVLFGASVRENLLLGRPDATDEELWSALAGVGAAGFVRDLPGRLDEELGSAGAGLSGGQAKRLCLARALLRDAPLLIVDEPFGGLDRATAGLVFAALEAAARERLVLVVTHDASRLAAFDRVLYMDAGRLVGDASHGELCESEPRYRRACGEEVPA